MNNPDLWKWIRTMIELVILAAAIVAFVLMAQSIGIAEEWDEHEEEFEIAYAICIKNDHVNVRPSPGTSQEPSGYLDPGDMVYLDGKKKNGYCHVVGLSNEAGEGWVHKGYLVEDKPELADADATIVSNGKLAARKYVNGKRTRWLKPGGTVHIWYMTDEWCSTNCGYIRTKYLELNGE